MTDKRNGDLVERVREAWGRPALSDAERVEFDAELRERLRQPRPRRGVWPGVALAAAAAVAMVVFSVRDGGEEAEWFDTLIDAQAVATGERSYSETLSFYGFESSDDTSVPHFGGLAWDASDTDSNDTEVELDLGHQYEVLAYWLAAPTDGDEAANTRGVP